MSLESTDRDDGARENAAEVLHEMTGRSKDEFDASKYGIPDVEDQEMNIKEE